MGRVTSYAKQLEHGGFVRPRAGRKHRRRRGWDARLKRAAEISLREASTLSLFDESRP